MRRGYEHREKYADELGDATSRQATQSRLEDPERMKMNTREPGRRARIARRRVIALSKSSATNVLSKRVPGWCRVYR